MMHDIANDSEMSDQKLQIQSEEFEALAAIYGDDFECDSSELAKRRDGNGADLNFTISPVPDVLLTFSLPPDYPAEPVQVHLTR